MEPVIIPASDGVPLPGYLTLPNDNVKNVPFVLAIHGGPYSLCTTLGDTMKFIEFLASRDYGVFKRQFTVGLRASAKDSSILPTRDGAAACGTTLTRCRGMGDRWQGYAESEAHRFLRRELWGLCGSDRGDQDAGYVRMRDSDLFGPSNLVRMMRSFPPYWTWLSRTWKRRRGIDPETEDGRAHGSPERSPLTHADKIVRPLLEVGQGMRDVRVTPKESEQIVQAMHGNAESRSPTSPFPTGRAQWLCPSRKPRGVQCGVAEAVPWRSIWTVRRSQSGTRSLGSTIKFEVGRELIPGLG